MAGPNTSLVAALGCCLVLASGGAGGQGARATAPPSRAERAEQRLVSIEAVLDVYTQLPESRVTEALWVTLRAIAEKAGQPCRLEGPAVASDSLQEFGAIRMLAELGLVAGLSRQDAAAFRAPEDLDDRARELARAAGSATARSISQRIRDRIDAMSKTTQGALDRLAATGRVSDESGMEMVLHGGICP